MTLCKEWGGEYEAGIKAAVLKNVLKKISKKGLMKQQKMINLI
ncbi:MAG: hypothetical protein ACE5GR_01850 [Nitrosopumilus sp.]